MSMLLSSLGTSIASVALPTLASEFAASFAAAQWIVLAYLLASTTLLVTVGRLGDTFGRRRLLLLGILLFTGAAAVAGAAPTLWVLIVARSAQGLGAAVMVTLTMALIGEAVPKDRTGSAMGLLGTMSAVGTALGPSLGGALIALAGWRAIFLLNVPLGLLSLVLVLRHLPAETPSRVRGPGRLDVPGTLLLAWTLGAYALAMTTGRGSFGSLGTGLLLAALVGLALFVWAQHRAASPLIRLSAFRDAQLSRAMVMSMLVSTVVMATLVVGPFYLSRALALDAARVGLVMSVGPLVSALTGVPAGRLVDRLGSSTMTLLGLGGMVLGTAAIALLPDWGGPFGYVVPLVAITACYALFQAANNTGVMANVAPDQRGVASALLNLARNLGLITGASFLGAVFAIGTGAQDVTQARPAEAVAGMQATFAVATLLVVVALGVGSRGRGASLRRAAERTGSATPPCRG